MLNKFSSPRQRGILLDKMQIITTRPFVFFVESGLQLLLYSAFFQLQVFWHGTKKLRLGKFWARKNTVLFVQNKQ